MSSFDASHFIAQTLSRVVRRCLMMMRDVLMVWIMFSDHFVEMSLHHVQVTNVMTGSRMNMKVIVVKHGQIVLTAYFKLGHGKVLLTSDGV